MRSSTVVIADVSTQERPRDPRLYQTQPIPGTKYSLRLFPGSYVAREWCLEFILTRSEKPILTPANVTVWHIPDPDWAEGVGYNRIFSLEDTFTDSLPGVPIKEEKYVLRDGEKVIVYMPKKSVEFIVPRRPPHTLPFLPGGEHYKLAFA
ncbi:hypothetical protein OH76DRAFT_1365989 [Lentinus brumalis]|uniref:Uncharacterized protein n=1 Tax=Lentinus brumalis TaxID=2498619 RepID=A0A371CJZ4_9APHY|nr:hypothetical protein OH76DRAFT_1365989 [Polyporus brumalis]